MRRLVDRHRHRACGPPDPAVHPTVSSFPSGAARSRFACALVRPMSTPRVVRPASRVFVGDELHWYRVFSFGAAAAPHLQAPVLQRRAASSTGRCRGAFAARTHRRAELPENEREQVEIAMAGTTVTGFMSWLEPLRRGGGLVTFRRSLTHSFTVRAAKSPSRYDTSATSLRPHSRRVREVGR